MTCDLALAISDAFGQKTAKATAPTTTKRVATMMKEHGKVTRMKPRKILGFGGVRSIRVNPGTTKPK